MYLEFYGLSRRPFSKTPDPAFLFRSRQHAEALARLAHAVEEREMAVLTGEVGAGKTTLSRALVDEFAPTLTANGARVSVHATPPSVLEWEDDLRTIRCFAFATDIDGGRLEISGSFDGEWEIVRFSEDDVTAEAPGPGSAAGS